MRFDVPVLKIGIYIFIYICSVLVIYIIETVHAIVIIGMVIAILLVTTHYRVTYLFTYNSMSLEDMLTGRERESFSCFWMGWLVLFLHSTNRLVRHI